MHLKRNDVVGPNFSLWPSDSPGSDPHTNNNSNYNNNPNPQDVTTTTTTHNNSDSEGVTTASTNNNNIEGLTTTITNYYNNNNNHHLGVSQEGKGNKPLLIIDTELVEEGYLSPSTISSSSTCTSTHATRVDDGMTTSPTSSLPDLSENVSCSSDRLHHPSISSGPPHLLHLLPPPRSVSSGSLSSYDESDLESYSSLEVDIHETKSNVDLDVLSYRSQWRSSERDKLPLKTTTYQPFNDLSPSPPLAPHSHNVNTTCDTDKTFYNKPKLCLPSASSSLTSLVQHLNGNVSDLVDNCGVSSENCGVTDGELGDFAGKNSNIVGICGDVGSLSNIVRNFGDADKNLNSTNENINTVGVEFNQSINPEVTGKEDSAERPVTEATNTYSDPETACEDHSPPDSPASLPLSDSDSPSDIEQRMAETEVKMNDAILSNGKEELELHGHKLKQYMKHRDTSSASINNNNNNNNQNNNNNNNLRQLGTLKLGQEPGDNRLKSTPESPIVDAYEKECLDQPEKMVKELETQAKETSSTENEEQENQGKEQTHIDETQLMEIQDKDDEGKESEEKETHVNAIQDDEGKENQEKETHVNAIQDDEDKESEEKETHVNGIKDDEGKDNLEKEAHVNGIKDDEGKENQENEAHVNGIQDNEGKENQENEAHVNGIQDNEGKENQENEAHVNGIQDDEGKENQENEAHVNGIQDDEGKENQENEAHVNGIQDDETLVNRVTETQSAETQGDETQGTETQTKDSQPKETLQNESQKTETKENETQSSETVPDPFVPYKRGKVREARVARRRREAAADSPSASPCLSPARRVSASPASTTERTRPVRVTFDEAVLQRVARREGSQQRRRAGGLSGRHFRRSVPQASSSTASASASSRGRLSSPDAGEFDVYTMETALPKIDWEAIESHLKATREEERRRRNDREEIRRKLAMGCDDEAALDRPHRKPSLHSRLQSGMNLQICFMNETASDCESQCSDTESTQDHTTSTTSVTSKSSRSKKSRKSKVTRRIRPQDSSDPDQEEEDEEEEEEEEEDEARGSAGGNFFARQAQLQAEARVALAQAKEMARMQMEIEKQSKKKSPIADIVRASFNKIGVPFPDSKRRISRQILTDMNVAQLQVIVNDLHTQIESLNEELVTFLMERDDLHMEQDSMLVDIEDLTKHIGAKELCVRDDVSKTSSPTPAPSLGTCPTPPLPSTPPLPLTPLLKSRSPGKLRGIVKK